MADINPKQNVTPVVVHEDTCELESWNNPTRGDVVWRTLISASQTPSKSMSCGITEISTGPNGILHAHRHAQPEIYYILSGSGLVTINNEEHQVGAGSTVFIPGNAIHSVRNVGDELLRFFYVFAADSFSDINYEFKAEMNVFE